jgi:hypothetical protein
MEIVARILSKVVGQEVSVEEMELVAGGRIDSCIPTGGYHTANDDLVGGGQCDYP